MVGRTSHYKIDNSLCSWLSKVQKTKNVRSKHTQINGRGQGV